jgi:hypothetical protein
MERERAEVTYADPVIPQRNLSNKSASGATNLAWPLIVGMSTSVQNRQIPHEMNEHKEE